jgi:hypothetical protein
MNASKNDHKCITRFVFFCLLLIYTFQLKRKEKEIMYDVIVIDARCADSPTAMLLARKGYPNFFRKAFGPGWTLVGDAGYHKNPILWHASLMPCQDAKLLPETIDVGFSGRSSSPETLSAYEQRCNKTALPVYETNSQFATQEPPSAEMQQLFQALRTNPVESNRFLTVVERSISPMEFLSQSTLHTFLNVNL